MEVNFSKQNLFSSNLYIVKILQEVLLIFYLFIVYHPLFIDLIDFQFKLSLTKILILSALALNISIMALIFLKRIRQYYFNLLMFRLGAILTLTCYMLIVKSLCNLCLFHHIIVFIFSTSIFYLSLNKKGIKSETI